MPQKRTHDIMWKYFLMKASTNKPMRIKDISTKNRFLPYASFLQYE